MNKLRNIYIYFASLLMVLLTVECDVHEFPGIQEPEPPAPGSPKLELRITLNSADWQDLTTIEYGTESSTTQSRGSRAMNHKMRFSVSVFDDYTDARAATRTLRASRVFAIDEPATLAEVDQLVDLDLPEGEYIALAWIDYVDADHPDSDLYYSTSDLSNISILGDDHPGNSHYREAFRGSVRFAVDAEGNALDIESRTEIQYIPLVAERPMARFEFITTDLNEFVKDNINKYSTEGELAAGGTVGPNLDDYIVVFRYTSYMPSVYNCHQNRPVDSDLGIYFHGHMQQINQTDAVLGFDHVFVNGTETNVQVALDVYHARTGELLVTTSTVTVPLKRNHHTTVRGKFLTTNAGSGVTINTAFDGQYNVQITF